MALLICHECGGRVSSEAVACPQCGAPPKKGLPSPPPVPPVIIVPPLAARLSEPVRQKPTATTTKGIKDKSKKLLAFSAVFIILVVIVFYNFLVGRQMSQENAAASNKFRSLLVSNINSLQQFSQQGAFGDVPEFKPTGNADMDTMFQTASEFYKGYMQYYSKQYSDIQALQEKDILDDSMLTNKAALETEIQKRIASQEIIKTFATNVLSMFENVQGKYAALNIPELYKSNSINAVEEASSKYYKPILVSRVKVQKTEQDLLQFMDDNFENYELKDGTIVFDSQAKLQKFGELAKNVQDANTETEELQKELQNRGAAVIGATKRKLQ